MDSGFRSLALVFFGWVGGHYLLSVLVLTRKCCWYSSKVIVVNGNGCFVIREQRPTCSWLAFVKLTKFQLNVKVLLFVYASRDNAVLTCGSCYFFIVP